ncbi:hypothetical protein [Rhodoferax sp.]|uniref:hypothetical protein n=1 Tax=Rhodoferax sp. TaxID=50421 RepID=UPI00277418FF|nr:hypothetical protein [Rhodoferax sp.]
MATHEVRSGTAAGAGLAALEGATEPGVGARQGDLFTPEGGGGYLNECATSKLLEGAKIRELADMGLPAIWIRIAEAIGYDHFLEMWRILDTAAELREIRRSENESMIEVQLRRYSSFRRFQRNRWVEELARNHLPPAVIQKAVKDRLGEKLDRSHIRKLARRGRMPR